MPVVSQYRPWQIQPNVVHFHGVVIFTGTLGVVDEGRTFTPGIVFVRNGVGNYQLNFNDGATVGFTAIAFTSVVSGAGMDPLLFTTINNGGAVAGAAGQAFMRFEVSDIAGTNVDPGNVEGFMFNLVRLNTTISVT